MKYSFEIPFLKQAISYFTLAVGTIRFAQKIVSTVTISVDNEMLAHNGRRARKDDVAQRRVGQIRSVGPISVRTKKSGSLIRTHFSKVPKPPQKHPRTTPQRQHMTKIQTKGAVQVQK